MNEVIDNSNLSVIIVNYSTFDLCLKCIASIRKYHIVEDKNIIVVDNASPDGSGLKLQAEFPNLNIVLSNTNGGFGAGVNIGMAKCHTELVLVLNPDTYFLDGNISKIVSYFSDYNDAGLIGLELINPDGTRQYSARRFYSVLDIVLRRTCLGKLSLFKQSLDTHLMRNNWSNGFFEADWVMGTGFVIRKNAFDEIQGMDESYFLYFEDVDLCARLWQSGWRVLAAPGVQLVHDHQRTSAVSPLSWAGKIHLTSLWRFQSKFGIHFFKHPAIRDRRKVKRPLLTA